jgi:hypothetical protein
MVVGRKSAAKIGARLGVREDLKQRREGAKDWIVAKRLIELV